MGKVSHKKLRKNFWGWRTFVGTEVLLRQSVKVQLDNFMTLTLFWTFAGVPNYTRNFCVSGIWKNT